jgi:hypothetical protein
VEGWVVANMRVKMQLHVAVSQEASDEHDENPKLTASHHTATAAV